MVPEISASLLLKSSASAILRVRPLLACQHLLEPVEVLQARQARVFPEPQRAEPHAHALLRGARILGQPGVAQEDASRRSPPR